MRDKIKRYQYVCRIVFSSFCFIAVLVSITQSFSNVSAVEGSASANASVTVSSACSFGRTNGSGEYSGILANNSSIEIVGSTFTTFCNDPGGYAVYAIGYSNNEYGNTDLIYNNEPTSTNNIKTNGDTTGSGNSNNGSSWKMKLVPVENNFTPVIENGYNNFGNIPSTYTKVASYNNVTINNADSTTGSSITTHYQATASSTQPAGTYAGTVKYTMVHPGANIPNQPYDCPANKICYFPNAGNTVADTMGDQPVSTSDNSAVLWASNFKRPGYGFVGWSDAYDYEANEGSKTNNRAHIYGPNETIDLNNLSTNGLSLYAIWVESTDIIQDWVCPNDEIFPIGNVTALTDLRDKQTYAVAKLADGNCWMIENLRLNNGPNVTASLSQGFGDGFIGLAEPESTSHFNSTEPNSLYNTGNAYTMPRFDNKNTMSPIANMTNIGQQVYSYGNYYTWAASIANLRSYGPNYVSNSSSICPKGWHLPYGGDSDGTYGGNTKGGFYHLGVQQGSLYDSEDWRRYPNNFLLSTFGNQVYRSATTSNYGGNYYLEIDSYESRPGTLNYFRYSRGVIRCVSQ